MSAFLRLSTAQFAFRLPALFPELGALSDNGVPYPDKDVISDTPVVLVSRKTTLTSESVEYFSGARKSFERSRVASIVSGVH